MSDLDPNNNSDALLTVLVSTTTKSEWQTSILNPPMSALRSGSKQQASTTKERVVKFDISQIRARTTLFHQPH